MNCRRSRNIRIGLTGSVFKFVVTRDVEHEDEIDEASGEDNHHCHLIARRGVARNTPANIKIK